MSMAEEAAFPQTAEMNADAYLENGERRAMCEYALTSQGTPQWWPKSGSGCLTDIICMPTDRPSQPASRFHSIKILPTGTDFDQSSTGPWETIL